jgi:hypothetical protein
MQAHAAELYLGSNRLLKMSFQGHEKNSSSKAINKPTGVQHSGTVANMPQFAPKTDHLLPHLTRN